MSRLVSFMIVLKLDILQNNKKTKKRKRYFVHEMLVKWLLAHTMLVRLQIKQVDEKLIESIMGLGPRQGNRRLVFRLFSLMRGLPSIRLKLKTSLRFLIEASIPSFFIFSPIIFCKTEYPLNS